MTDPHEPIWRALASPVRRAIMDLLRPAPLSTSDVVLAFPDLSRFAVMQHLGVLEEAGLVIAHKFGRVRLNCLNAVPLREVTRRWLDRFDDEVSDGLLAMKRRIEATESPEASNRIAEPTSASGRRPRLSDRSRSPRVPARDRSMASKKKRNRRHA